MPRPGTATVDPRMLPGIRAAAAGAMIDTCRITKPAAGGRTYNPATKTSSGAAPVPVREGACYLQVRLAEQQTPQLGGRPVSVRGYYAAVPIDWDDVEVGHTFTVLTSADPRLVDRTFSIADVTVDTFAAQRDLELEEVTGG